MGSGEEAGHSGRASPGHAMLIQGTQGQVSGVVGAIRDAATATGTNFEYLLATARVESGLDPQASASSSSARGLFQFIEQTWLTTMKEAGPSRGDGADAAHIKQLPSGRYEVDDPAIRQKILALRNDPTANAAMAGAFTRANAEQLSERLGRPPSDGELYIAHFLGPAGAGRLIGLAGTSPGASAASAFPGAARANRSIFYDRQGHARTAAQVYGELVGRYQTAASRNGPAVAADVAPRALNGAVEPSRATGAGVVPLASNTLSPVAAGAIQPNGSARGARSLFSDTDRGAVSQVIRDLWTTRPTVAAALMGPSAATGAAARNANSAGAPRDLFADQPSNVRGMFGVKS